MITNGGGYYPSPYGSMPFSNISNNFGLGSPTNPPFYNSNYPPQTRPVTQPNIPGIPSFKLYDLDTHAQSEIIRLIFSYAGVLYKDKRFKQEEWDKIKSQMSFEQLPILRINNHFKIFHLQAIVRYLAREFHLYGINKQDHVIVDIILETIRPLQEKIFEQLTNSTDQEQAFKQLIIDHSTTCLNHLEKFYEIFNRHGPFYLGPHISLADLVVYDTINYLLKFEPKLLENYSHIKESRRRLEKHPKISTYLNNKLNHQSESSHQTNVPSQRHRTKSPTPNLASHHHHHHHRHRSHDGHRTSQHYHYRHHRHHSKEPSSLSHTKRSTKSPSVTKKDKESTDIIPPPPPLTTTEQTSESKVH